jgi:hypothetical protein
MEGRVVDVKYKRKNKPLFHEAIVFKIQMNKESVSHGNH